MVSHPRPFPIARRASSWPAVLGLRRERAASAVAQLGGSAPLLIIAVAVSIQAGSALATRTFASAGVVGTLWLRVSIAAILLVLVGRRWLRLPPPGSRLNVAALGVVLAAMNICFFEAIARLPLGVAATIDFLGPLVVALTGSRGRFEIVGVVLAGAGVALLGIPTTDVDRVGLAFALASAACWGIYIVLAKRAISHVEPLTALVGALAVSSLLLLPGALVAGGSSLWDGSVLATALAVAVLATALPYVLELVALKLVRASTFSVLLSLEPAVAALVGFALLGQRLGTFEVLAVVCVVVGSTAASRRAKTPPLT